MQNRRIIVEGYKKREHHGNVGLSSETGADLYIYTGWTSQSNDSDQSTMDIGMGSASDGPDRAAQGP